MPVRTCIYALYNIVLLCIVSEVCTSCLTLLVQILHLCKAIMVKLMLIMLLFIQCAYDYLHLQSGLE